MAHIEFFDEHTLDSFLLRGALREAMAYLERFPECAGRAEDYRRLFREERYRSYGVDGELEALLLIFQRYYRDVFYSELPPEQAERAMAERFAARLHLPPQPFDDMEEAHIAKVFEAHGFHYLGGRTDGCYGPHIWKTTRPTQYQVELPGGTQTYTVNLLSGFLCKSWLDYISFGRRGTGGWSNGDGVINCVEDAYDFSGEDFAVSLLKHEAQHVMDLAASPDMPSDQLEYRAKLVELIYSSERNLLPRFALQADPNRPADGHCAAAERILSQFAQRFRCPRATLSEVPIPDIQSFAVQLFHEHTAALYGARP